MVSDQWRLLEPFVTLNRPIVLAYSGGADSSVLLAALVRAGGAEALIAATYKSPLHHSGELRRAAALTRKLGVEHLIVEEDPLADKEFAANPEERCYLCKKRRLAGLASLARERGAPILDGTNFSDTRVYRPGLKALEEAGVIAPLAQAGLTKEQVGELGRWLGVEDWIRPASACLATRVPYGFPLTAGLLENIRRAEESLAALWGVELGSFRVRAHGSLARVETDPALWPRIMAPDLLSRTVRELKRFGFVHASLDLEGYVSGSMDREGMNTE